MIILLYYDAWPLQEEIPANSMRHQSTGWAPDDIGALCWVRVIIHCSVASLLYFWVHSPLHTFEWCCCLLAYYIR